MKGETVVTPLAINIASGAIATHTTPAVPNGYTWQHGSWLFALTSSATVGNRQIEFQVLDAGGTVRYRQVVGATQAASLTRKYQFSNVAIETAAFRDTDFLLIPLPGMLLPGGYTSRIIDNKAIDAADVAVSSILITQSPVP